MMSSSALLRRVRTEITAAEGRASALADAVRMRLRAGDDSTDAEQALFHVLDSLALLRAKQQALHLVAIESPRHHSAAA